MNYLQIKKFKRLLAFITCLALVGMFIPDKPTTVITPATADTTMTVAQIQKNMGLGFNIGNALDSCDDSHKCNAQDHELEWGNPAITQAYVNTIYEKGFRSIRLPVTWYEFISKDGNYTIDESYLARVKEVVDYAYGKGMYVILNVHHETWINRSDFATAYSSISPELKKVWTQIATYFANYDQHLIFEGMNEPRVVNNDSIKEWQGNAACYEVVNKLDADFIKTVRSIDSPYKNTRMLMVPCYAASGDLAVYDAMDMNLFSDPYVAASIHAYKPYDFAMNGTADHSSFDKTYQSQLDVIFSDLRTKFTSQNVPVVLGEFSASNFNNLQARKDWASYYMAWAKKLGIPCFLWDNNVIEVQSNGEAHGYLNRSGNVWYSQSEPVVDMLLSTLKSDSIGWKEEATYPIYKHNTSAGATVLSIASDGLINNLMSQLTSGKELAITYRSKAPTIALMDADWGGWTTISANDIDPQNKIAYFSYDAIVHSWSNGNAIAYAKLLDYTNETAYILTATGEKVPTTTEAATEATTKVTTTTTKSTTTTTKTVVTTTTEVTTSSTTTTKPTTTAATNTTAAKPTTTATTNTTAVKPATTAATNTTAAKPATTAATNTTAVKPTTTAATNTTTTKPTTTAATNTTAVKPTTTAATNTTEDSESPSTTTADDVDAENNTTQETTVGSSSESASNTTEGSSATEETVQPNTDEVSNLIVNANYTDQKKMATYKIMGISKKGTYMVRYVKPKKSKATTISVPKTVSINGTTCKVTSIAPRAFYKNKKLKKITLGANIIRIGERAFYGCSKLSKVIMKKKVKEVGKQAFGKCKKLKKFTVGKKKISYKKFLKRYK